MHRSTFTAFVLLPFVVIPASPVPAQEDPIESRGFTPERAFLAGDVDFIDQFTGNLVLAVPIGQRYPVSANLSYQLTLSFNANYWTDWSHCIYDIGGGVMCHSDSIPDGSFNNGAGWLLSLGGRLLPPAIPDNPSPRWLFVAADGSGHSFWNRLHDTDAEDTGDTSTSQKVVYSRDASYLRMTADSTRGRWPSTGIPRRVRNCPRTS